MKGSSMGFWWFYFLVKIYLHLKGSLQLDFLWNLSLLVFLKIPIPEKLRERRFPGILKQSLSVGGALLLVWHESWFPPFSNFTRFLWESEWPDTSYIVRFLGGFFDPSAILVIGALLALCLVIQRYLTLTPLVVFLLLVVPLGDYTQAQGDPDHFLTSFHRSEADRRIDLGRGKADPDFDVIILHVCSLSWDDLEKSGLKNDPFLQKFDLLLTQFNSATSYSNPSAIRLLRANCGQLRHRDLYHPVPDDCCLMESLRARGYRTYALFNHDGRYGGFSEELQSLGPLDPPLSVQKVPIRRINFEGSPIRDDYASLITAWKFREKTGAPRGALYYNTITLHDGSRRSDDPEWWKRDRGKEYRAAVRKLFSDMTRFFERLHRSGREILILFIPEHGVALEGDSLQPPGLREIPLPRITHVPVGIKWIGRGGKGQTLPRREISKPTSYLAVSAILAEFLRAPASDLPESAYRKIVSSIPETEFVAENKEVRVFRREGETFLENRGSGVPWVKISAESGPREPIGRRSE